MRGSVKRWIAERNAALRISRSAPARAARELDITARMTQAQAATAAVEPSQLRKREETEIAAFLAQREPEALPTRRATAPAIATIRRAQAAGKPIRFQRGNRSVVFNPVPLSGPVGVKSSVHDEGGARSRRRHKRRSPHRNQTPP